MGDARDGDVKFSDFAGEVEGGGFAFSGGVCGDDDLADLSGAEAVEEAVQAQFAGANAFQGVQHAMEDVV